MADGAGVLVVSVGVPSTAFATFGFAASSAIVFPSIPRSLYALDSPHTAHKLSARAGRRQAALQRQEREREDQQWFEQLRYREPKAPQGTREPRFDLSLERSEPWFSS
jgi:hypothetical protein